MGSSTAGKLFRSNSSETRLVSVLNEVRRRFADRIRSVDDDVASSRRETGADRERQLPTQLKTPEERIVEVVSENGGGMKQKAIVSALRWSESTISRKLCNLESDGTVIRYQIGREKMVYLPGHEPATLASPFQRNVPDDHHSSTA